MTTEDAMTGRERCRECMNGRCGNCRAWRRGCDCGTARHYGIRTQPGWWENEALRRWETYDDRGQLVSTWYASMTRWVVLRTAAEPEPGFRYSWDGVWFDREAGWPRPAGFAITATGKLDHDARYGVGEVLDAQPVAGLLLTAGSPAGTPR